MSLINKLKEGLNMGLFVRKKEKEKPEVVNISGAQLCGLLKNAISLAAEHVEARCYVTGPEIMFEYNNKVHFIGIKYDKKRAKTEKRVTFSNELMSVYLDKQLFVTLEDLRDHATLDGKILTNISNGIIVSPEYKEFCY
jgi:hypothetical protein